MGQKEIEQSFARAGWDIDDSFAEYLVIGTNDDGLSILAHTEAWCSDDPVFEIIEHERIKGKTTDDGGSESVHC